MRESNVVLGSYIESFAKYTEYVDIYKVGVLMKIVTCEKMILDHKCIFRLSLSTLHRPDTFNPVIRVVYLDRCTARFPHFGQ